MSGPPPKRKEERRRRNKAKDGVETETVPPVAKPLKAPPALSGWCAAAKRFYTSLRTSGQAQFYETSDWEYARFLCDQMTKLYMMTEPNAALMKQIQVGMTELLVSEGARRRVRLEIDKKETPDPPSLRLMNKYQQAAGNQS